MSKTVKLKAIALLSPHILCCGVLPFAGAFAGEFIPWVDNLWVKLALAVGLTTLILVADDLWHKTSKEPHVGPCEALHGKKGTSFNKYAVWIGFATLVTVLLHALDTLFIIHSH